MKTFKTLLLSLTIALIAVFTLNTNQINAASSSASGANNVTNGGQVDIIFNVSGATVTSGSIEISTSSSLTVVKGEWLVKNTTLVEFSNNKGAFALSKAAALSGSYFKVTVKGNTIDPNAYVKATITLKNGKNSAGSTSTTKSLAVICSTHSYGAETRVEPTCTNAGYVSKVCTVCKYESKTSIAPLGHVTDGFTIEVQAGCLTTGTQSGICSRCNQKASVEIAAKGHDFGSWTTITPATCTETGLQSHKCKACDYEETAVQELAKHTLTQDLTVVKEPTLTSYGIVEAVCDVCGNIVRQESDCAYTDQNTGILINCKEGTFDASTSIVLTKLEANSDEYKQATQIIDNFSSKYTIYDFSAYLNDVKVQPNGEITVTLEVEEGYSDKLALVYIGEDGGFEVAESTYKDGKLTATLSHFSTYAIVDLGVTKGNTNIFMYTTIAASALAVVFFVLFIKNKKKAN